MLFVNIAAILKRKDEDEMGNKWSFISCPDLMDGEESIGDESCPYLMDGEESFRDWNFMIEMWRPLLVSVL